MDIQRPKIAKCSVKTVTERKRINIEIAICEYIQRSPIHKLMDYTARGGDVADSWYSERFDVAYRDIYEGCTALLDAVLKQDKQ